MADGPAPEFALAPNTPPLTLSMTTPRLVLREYQEADIPIVTTYLSDARYWQHLAADPLSADQIGDLIRFTIASQAGNPRPVFHLCAQDARSGEIVGEAVIKGVGSGQPAVEIGWGIARAFWGQGFATEIGRALMAACFDTLGVHRVTAICSLENKAAVRVMQKLGMAREGVLREHVHVRGRYWSSVLYAMLSPEYRKIVGVAARSRTSGG